MERPSYQQLWQSLVPPYEAGEARAMVRLLMETEFGLGLPDLLCYGTSQLDDSEQKRLQEMMRRLQATEPIQYVLGKAMFCGRMFHVEPGVLIPRPETEVLCRWVMETSPQPSPKGREAVFTYPRILDIGCGSGCIAVTLALEIEGAQVTACDISPKALEVTQHNAARLGAQIDVRQQDILSTKLPTEESKASRESRISRASRDSRKANITAESKGKTFDIIVSNPPYICHHEAAAMHPNVLRHEPHEALFVPDADPLCFYSAIARYARVHLRPGGLLFFECNAAHTGDVAHLLSASGFRDVTTRNDDFGKTRFVKAINNI